MARRLSSLFARRPRPADSARPEPPVGEPGAAEPRATDGPAPSPALPPPRRPARSRGPRSLEQERRQLLRQREIEIRDIGGLALEMARRDDWRYELLASRCAEVLGLEDRVQELDALRAAADVAARGMGAQQCKCGAPILRGSHFCSHCGRPATQTPPVVACSHCGQPLPADVNFCPVCGNAVAAEEFEAADAVDSTMVRPAPPAESDDGGR